MNKALAMVLLLIFCLCFLVGCSTGSGTKLKGSSVDLQQGLNVGGGGNERATVRIRGRYGPNGEVPNFHAAPLLEQGGTR